MLLSFTILVNGLLDTTDYILTTGVLVFQSLQTTSAVDSTLTAHRDQLTDCHQLFDRWGSRRDLPLLS